MKTISSSNSQKRTVQTKLYKITKIAPPYSLKQFDLKTSVLLYHGYIVANPKLPKDVLLDCLQKKGYIPKSFPSQLLILAQMILHVNNFVIPYETTRYLDQTLSDDEKEILDDLTSKYSKNELEQIINQQCVEKALQNAINRQNLIFDTMVKLLINSEPYNGGNLGIKNKIDLLIFMKDDILNNRADILDFCFTSDTIDYYTVTKQNRLPLSVPDIQYFDEVQELFENTQTEEMSFSKFFIVFIKSLKTEFNIRKIAGLGNKDKGFKEFCYEKTSGLKLSIYTKSTVQELFKDISMLLNLREMVRLLNEVSLNIEGHEEERERLIGFSENPNPLDQNIAELISKIPADDMNKNKQNQADKTCSNGLEVHQVEATYFNSSSDSDDSSVSSDDYDFSSSSDEDDDDEEDVSYKTSQTANTGIPRTPKSFDLSLLSDNES